MSQHEHRRLVSAESAILASGLQPLQKKYCLKCDVQYTWCKLRRSQLGYIELTLPVTHVWYLKGTTSLLGNLFGLKKKVILSIAYNSATTVFETSQKAIEKSITYLAEATSLSNLGC
jgi:DNA-directed RNA polymerase beta' subunit